MNGVAVFLLSDMRSGSTLLDLLLGAHPSVVSLGEIHWLTAYVRQDRTLYDPDHELNCTCGLTVIVCPFWSAVARRIGRPLDALTLRAEPQGTARRILARWPALYRSSWCRDMLGQGSLPTDSWALFDAALAVSGRTLAVDSSKSTFRYRAVRDARPDRTRAIVLTRDYRAVTHSKMKRGHSLEDAVAGWRRKMEQIDALTSDIPADQLHTLSYETLCREPERALTEVCGFLGVDFVAQMLERPGTEVHHIGGSPSKFDRTRVAIRADDAYRTAFTEAQLARMTAIAGDAATSRGY